LFIYVIVKSAFLGMIVHDSNFGRDTRTCMDEALDNIIDSFKSIVI